MERPSEHGGGGAGPAIAGDPTSFPSDAELARTLTAGQRQATLCTLTADGYPYGSVVSYAVDDAGAPLLLISELAEHTVNARGDDRVSMLRRRPRHVRPIHSAAPASLCSDGCGLSTIRPGRAGRTWNAIPMPPLTWTSQTSASGG